MKGLHYLKRIKWKLSREFYPEKNQYEAKAKKDYGNKAYQQGKDLDALYLYTQVNCKNLVAENFQLSDRKSLHSKIQVEHFKFFKDF